MRNRKSFYGSWLVRHLETLRAGLRNLRTPWHPSELAQPKPKPGFDESGGTSPGAKNLLEYLRRHEPSRIVVDRYSPEAGPWGGKSLWMECSLKSELVAVMTARMEGMFSQIVWSEFNTWSATAALTFKDGTQGKILLD